MLQANVFDLLNPDPPRLDRTFHIEELSQGRGAPVFVANGFLTRNKDTSEAWLELVEKRYPRAPCCRVHWDTGTLLSWRVLAAALAVASRSSASVKAPFLLRDWWRTARDWADEGGKRLATEILGHPRRTPFHRRPVLIGHSLGAALMFSAARSLGEASRRRPLDSVHLMGAAVPDSAARSDVAAESVRGAIWNYHSTNDPVLKMLFRLAELGDQAAGRTGFNCNRIIDVDVSTKVRSHGQYLHGVTLR